MAERVNDEIDRTPEARTVGEHTRGRGTRRAVLAGSLVAAAALFPFDGAVSGWARALGSRLGGDAARELEAWQQFGGLVSMVVAAALIWVLDPGRRRRLLDLAAAAACAGSVVFAAKLTVGRARPKFGDPWAVLGPFGAYPLAEADPPGVYRSWEVWEPISSDLWSMPSSHTSSAVVLAVFIGVLYPRARWVVGVLAGVVAAARVMHGAHWATDVVVGAGVGFACGHAAVTGGWGVRALDWVWVRTVDAGAQPAWAAIARAERERECARREGGSLE